MTQFTPSDRDVNRVIRSWLLEDRQEDVSRIAGVVLDQLDTTPQRRTTWWPAWRTLTMNKFLAVGLGAAAVVAVLLIGSNLIGSGSPTPGGQPSELAAPSGDSSPASSPIPLADGDLEPGTYMAHPLPAYDSLTLIFTVPAGWTNIGGSLVTEPDTAIQFDDVTSLNGDPCHWSGTADDISVGPTVDDLVNALLAQTAYEVSEPVDVTIGGYSGQRVDLVFPTEPFDSSGASACDEGAYLIWSTVRHGPAPIHAQGPENRWQTNVLNVDGTRLVIVAQDFPTTSDADRAEMDAIINSIVIEP